MILWLKFLVPNGFTGITLYPFILIKDISLKQNKVFVNHEKIHLQQQLELFILVFYLWYGIEFMYKWIKFKDKYLAYKAISFEREAYSNENDLSYIKKRPNWAFLKYL